MYAPSWRRGPAASTGRLAALALGLAVLAGCGSAAAPSSASPGSASSGSASPHSVPSGRPAAQASAARAAAPPHATASPSALCANLSRVSRLAIVRSRDLNRLQELHLPFPPKVIVTNAAAARAVAAAVCALPRMPAGPRPCPMQLLGTTYQLTFTAAGRELPVVTAEATGCEQVTGAGPVRQAVGSAGFWAALGQAMNLVEPGPPVFRGDGPAASQCAAAQARLRVMSGCPEMSGFRK